MKFIAEEKDFGIMKWKLLGSDSERGIETYCLPVLGIGTYLRTRIGQVWEEPVLIKNALVLELIAQVREEQKSGLVDAQGNEQAPKEPPKFQCLNREIVSLELAKKRLLGPKGKDHPGLDIVAGAIIVQEQRPMPMVQPPGAPPPEVLKKLADAKMAEAQS
jgi:hypothetical protein